MIIYVSCGVATKQSNIEKAKKIMNDLQSKDLANCYICPLLAFGHIRDEDIDPKWQMALRLDLLSVCDVLLVASKINPEIKQEIEFANLVGMEVRRFEEKY